MKKKIEKIRDITILILLSIAVIIPIGKHIYKKSHIKFADETVGQVAGGSNENVTFDFDRAAFQELVSDDKIAMDIACVDCILDKDALEITTEEYERIAILIGNQPFGNTALVEHILNSAYCWEFVDCLVLEGQEMPKGGEGISSSGVFMPTEKYWKLLTTLKSYAVNLSVNQPENAVGTPYIGIMNQVIRYEQLFSTLVICMQDRTYAYESGQAEEMLHNNIGTMFQVRMGDTSVEKYGKAYRGLLLTIAGGSAPVNIEVMGAFASDMAISVLNQLQNSYINKYETYLNQASTINVLDLNSAVTKYTNNYVEGSKEIITVYPRRETQARLDKLNEFLQGEGERFIKKEEMKMIPDGGFTVEYVTNHLAEVDAILDKIEKDVRKNDYAFSLLEALGLE